MTSLINSFNSFEVRLIHWQSLEHPKNVACFNSFEVRLIHSNMIKIIGFSIAFQFLWGSINTLFIIGGIVVAFARFNSFEVRLILGIFEILTQPHCRFNSFEVRLIHDTVKHIFSLLSCFNSFEVRLIHSYAHNSNSLVAFQFLWGSINTQM